jgi:hypothetical protein
MGNELLESKIMKIIIFFVVIFSWYLIAISMGVRWSGFLHRELLANKFSGGNSSQSDILFAIVKVITYHWTVYDTGVMAMLASGIWTMSYYFLS